MGFPNELSEMGQVRGLAAPQSWPLGGGGQKWDGEWRMMDLEVKEI